MRTPEQEAHEAHWAMRERSQHTKDGLLTDKMRYRKALLLACGGDEAKARQFLEAAAGVAPSGELGGLLAEIDRAAGVQGTLKENDGG